MINDKVFNINYGDFYKFTISTSVLLFLISIIAISFMVINRTADVLKIGSIHNIVTTIYFLLGVICVLWIYWAVKKWKLNQEFLDALIKLDFWIKHMDHTMNANKNINYLSEEKRRLKKENLEMEKKILKLLQKVESNIFKTKNLNK